MVMSRADCSIAGSISELGVGGDLGMGVGDFQMGGMGGLNSRESHYGGRRCGPMGYGGGLPRSAGMMGGFGGCGRRMMPGRFPM